jgi:hypothetical protein
MKKIMLVAYFLLLIFFLSACENVNGNDNENTTAGEQTHKTDITVEMEVYTAGPNPYAFISQDDLNEFSNDWHDMAFRSVDYLKHSKEITEMADLADISPGIVDIDEDLLDLIENALAEYDTVFISLFLYYPYLGDFSFEHTYDNGVLSLNVSYIENHMLQLDYYGMLIFKINSSQPITAFDIAYVKTMS